MNKVFPLLMIGTLVTGCAGMDKMSSGDMMMTDKKTDAMESMDNDKMKNDNSMDKAGMTGKSMSKDSM